MYDDRDGDRIGPLAFCSFGDESKDQIILRRVAARMTEGEKGEGGREGKKERRKRHPEFVPLMVSRQRRQAVKAESAPRFSRSTCSAFSFLCPVSRLRETSAEYVPPTRHVGRVRIRVLGIKFTRVRSMQIRSSVASRVSSEFDVDVIILG